MAIVIGIVAVVAALVIFFYISMKQGEKETQEQIAAHKLPREQEQWLSFGAVMTEYRGEIPQIMKITKGTVEEYREGVAAQWEVSDAKSAQDTINWLLSDGHRHKYATAFSQVKMGDRPDELDDEEWKSCEGTLKNLKDDMKMDSAQIEAIPSMSAWDFERAAFLARVFAFMGFITEDEAFAILKQVGIAVRAEFEDWNSYFASFLLGRVIAYGGDSYAMVLNAQELFKPGNIWAVHPLKQIPSV